MKGMMMKHRRFRAITTALCCVLVTATAAGCVLGDDYETLRAKAFGINNAPSGNVTINSVTIETDDAEIEEDLVEGYTGRVVTVHVGEEYEFYAALDVSSKTAGDDAYKVTWSISNGSGETTDIDAEEGILTIDSNEAASPETYSRSNRNQWITITATSVSDPKKSDTLLVKVMAGDPGITNPTSKLLTVEVVPAGAATLAIRVDTTTAVIQNGADVLAGSKVGIYYTQTTAQRTTYTFESITAEPDIDDFGTGDGTSSAKRWVFTMPNADTVITLEFNEAGGSGDTPKLTWTTNNPTAVAVTILNGGTITSGSEVAAGSDIRVVATLTAGQTATLTGVTHTGSGTVAAPWVFTMPATDTSFAVSFNTANTANTEIEMVYVPGGSFQMGDTGSGYSDERPVHTVTVSGFYMGKYEVTQEQYQTVMGSNPSYFSSNPATGETQNKRPVEEVTWDKAVEFCNKLSEREGLTRAYTISGTNVTWNRNATGYRLPTEAEWEYAAKGGNGSPGNYTYSGSNNVGEVAWYYGNSGSKTHEVGKKAPNGLGLYDMSGNVWEWCWDWYGTYPSTAQTDPTGASSGSIRVRRGGGWFDSAEDVRSAYRNYFIPYYRYFNLGFRLARP